jgi:hypothetical protein
MGEGGEKGRRLKARGAMRRGQGRFVARYREIGKSKRVFVINLGIVHLMYFFVN